MLLSTATAYAVRTAVAHDSAGWIPYRDGAYLGRGDGPTLEEKAMRCSLSVLGIALLFAACEDSSSRPLAPLDRVTPSSSEPLQPGAAQATTPEEAMTPAPSGLAGTPPIGRTDTYDTGL